MPAQEDTDRLAGVRETVEGVIADVRERGDDAVREYSEKCDDWSPPRFRLGAEEIVAGVPATVIEGHARSGDVRLAKYRENGVPSWASA